MFSLRRLFWCRAREIHWKTTADLNVFAKRLPRSTRALACKITRICLVPLFRTAAGKIGALTSNAMWQQDAYRMIQRRAAAAGVKTRIGNHTFRATGITAYLQNKGTLETAQQLANHESPRTTKLYDRRQDEISLDEVEKISI